MSVPQRLNAKIDVAIVVVKVSGESRIGTPVLRDRVSEERMRFTDVTATQDYCGTGGVGYDD